MGDVMVKRGRARLGSVLVVAVAAAMVAAGCQSGGGLPVASGASDPRKGGGASSPSPTPTPSAKIVITPARSSAPVTLDTPVKVTATGGTLTDVSVRAGDGGEELAGTLNVGSTIWTSTGGLAPDSSYEVRAEAVNPPGRRAESTRSFRTMVPDKVLGTDITPLDGETVGVGMPIVVKFNYPVKDRATIEKRLVVETSGQVEGAWHWFSDSEVHYRPRKYWPSNTDVTLRVNTRGVNSGDDAWGVKDKVKRFRVGNSVVSKVDLYTDQTRVYVKGRLARTIPVTGGKPGWETRDGTKIILERRTNVLFRNEAIGAQEHYRLTSAYALRVTWSGEFLHTATWSEWAHGQQNVSHGCVGMNTANSAWLWNVSKVGDPVEIKSSGPAMEVTGNGYGDWNMSWWDWKRGSALT